MSHKQCWLLSLYTSIWKLGNKLVRQLTLLAQGAPYVGHVVIPETIAVYMGFLTLSIAGFPWTPLKCMPPLVLTRLGGYHILCRQHIVLCTEMWRGCWISTSHLGTCSEQCSWTLHLERSVHYFRYDTSCFLMRIAQMHSNKLRLLWEGVHHAYIWYILHGLTPMLISTATYCWKCVSNRAIKYSMHFEEVVLYMVTSLINSIYQIVYIMADDGGFWYRVASSLCQLVLQVYMSTCALRDERLGQCYDLCYINLLHTHWYSPHMQYSYRYQGQTHESKSGAVWSSYAYVLIDLHSACSYSDWIVNPCYISVSWKMLGTSRNPVYSLTRRNGVSTHRPWVGLP